MHLGARAAPAGEENDRLRRYPRGVDSHCKALLLSDPSQLMGGLGVFPSSAILDIASLSWVPGTRHQASFEWGFPWILAQYTLFDSHQAVARMLWSDHLPSPYRESKVLNWTPVRGPSLETPATELERLGLKPITGLLTLTDKNNPNTLQENLEKLEDTIFRNGPIAVAWDLALGSHQRIKHWIILDSAHPENLTVWIRDPFHVWSVRVTALEFFRGLFTQSRTPDSLDWVALGRKAHPNRHWLRRTWDRWMESHEADQKRAWRHSLVLALDRKEQEARAAHGGMARLWQDDFRPRAIEFYREDRHQIASQLSLYPKDSIEFAKLSYGVLALDLRIARLESERVLLEFGVLQAEELERQQLVEQSVARLRLARVDTTTNHPRWVGDALAKLRQNGALRERFNRGINSIRARLKALDAEAFRLEQSLQAIENDPHAASGIESVRSRYHSVPSQDWIKAQVLFPMLKQEREVLLREAFEKHLQWMPGDQWDERMRNLERRLEQWRARVAPPVAQ